WSHSMLLPARHRSPITSISKLCPQAFRAAGVKPLVGQGRCGVAVGPVDSGDNHGSRRSGLVFLSTGPVDKAVDNSGWLWMNEGVHKLSTLHPQLHPQISPGLSTADRGLVIR